MGVAVEYVSQTHRLAEDFSKAIILIGGFFGLVGLINRLVVWWIGYDSLIGSFTAVQFALVLIISGGLVNLGARVHDRGGSDWAIMGLYGWGMTALADLSLHIFFMMDITGVEAPGGHDWILGALNLGFFQIEPWWYFIIDTGFIGAFVLAAATAVGFPRTTSFRYLLWPLLGGVMKSFFYADLTRVVSYITQGWISIRGEWGWTTLWVEVYNISPFTPADVDMNYFYVQQDFAAVFLVFAFQHWLAILVAALIAHQMRYGDEMGIQD